MSGGRLGGLGHADLDPSGHHSGTWSQGPAALSEEERTLSHLGRSSFERPGYLLLFIVPNKGQREHGGAQ